MSRDQYEGPMPKCTIMDIKPPNYWPVDWPSPTIVLCDGSSPKNYALLAGWLLDTVYGWHSFQSLSSSMEEAMQKVQDAWMGPGLWWQIIHMPTGEIVASGSQKEQKCGFSD